MAEARTIGSDNSELEQLSEDSCGDRAANSKPFPICSERVFLIERMPGSELSSCQGAQRAPKANSEQNRYTRDRGYLQQKTPALFDQQRQGLKRR
jgi:hypothetical protein